MLVACTMFACCVLDKSIIVAGGFTNSRKSISNAEIYDPERDIWEPIAELQHSHNSACCGLVFEGKLHVLHKGLSIVQIFEVIRAEVESGRLWLATRANGDGERRILCSQ